VDTSLFTPDKDGSRFRERFNIAPDETLVLFVGRLVPHKGIRYLLQAASLIKNRKIKFLIAGEGPLLTALKKETARRGLPDRVKFSGRVAHEDLPFCYAACDIFVLPSTSRLEAFGIATLEAMSSGKPVIVSDIPGVRETIQNGDQGLLVNAFSPEDIAEKILYLHENPPERKRMGASARRTVEEKYSWQKVITQIETAYKEMMTRRAITKN
jgi:glycosyltransferase involved in cell wall biosynthesis